MYLKAPLEIQIAKRNAAKFDEKAQFIANKRASRIKYETSFEENFAQFIAAS